MTYLEEPCMHGHIWHQSHMADKPEPVSVVCTTEVSTVESLDWYRRIGLVLDM